MLRSVLSLLLAVVLVGCTAADRLQPTPAEEGNGGKSSQTPPVRWSMIRMSSENNGWAIKDGGIFRTNDGGNTWNRVTPPGVELKGTRADWAPAYFLDADRAWIAHNHERRLTVYRTVNGGQSWTTVDVDAEGEAQLHFVDEQYGWMLLHQGVAMGSEKVAVYSTTDGGETWTKVAGAGPDGPQGDGSLPFGGIKKGITFKDGSVGWVTAEDRAPGGGRLYKTTDRGTTWVKHELQIPEAYKSHSLNIYPPKFFSATEAILPVTFVPGYETIFYTTKDGGQTWAPTTPVKATITSTAVTYDFVDAKHGWTTDGENIYISQDGGHTWTVNPAPSNFRTAKQLQFITPKFGWAVTDDGLMTTTDGGRTWR